MIKDPHAVSEQRPSCPFGCVGQEPQGRELSGLATIVKPLGLTFPADWGLLGRATLSIASFELIQRMTHIPFSPSLYLTVWLRQQMHGNLQIVQIPYQSGIAVSKQKCSPLTTKPSSAILAEDSLNGEKPGNTLMVTFKVAVNSLCKVLPECASCS